MGKKRRKKEKKSNEKQSEGMECIKRENKNQSSEYTRLRLSISEEPNHFCNNLDYKRKAEKSPCYLITL